MGGRRREKSCRWKDWKGTESGGRRNTEQKTWKILRKKKFWTRRKRESRKTKNGESEGKIEESPKEKVEEKPRLSSLILPELHCQNCHELLSPPSNIYQCSDLHKTCQACRQGDDLKKCPLCSGSIMGRNVALENVAARLFSGKYKSDSSLEESLDLTLRSPSEGVGSSI